jgi:hypothetical protein
MIRRGIQRKVDENRDFPPHELRSCFVPEIRRESDVNFLFLEGDLVFHNASQSVLLETSSSHAHKKKKMSNTHNEHIIDEQETIVATIDGTVHEKPNKIVVRKRKR